MRSKIMYEKAADRRIVRNSTHKKSSNYFDIGGKKSFGGSSK